MNDHKTVILNKPYITYIYHTGQQHTHIKARESSRGPFQYIVIVHSVYEFPL